MKELIMMIGASGSGKSTLRVQLTSDDPGMLIHSWDEYRLEFARESIKNFDKLDRIEQYRKAFELSAKGGSFDTRVKKIYTDQLKTGRSILVDNTNLSTKRRGQFLEQARGAGYNTVAYLFPISRAELIRRAEDRIDHKVPVEIVLNQWKSLQLPSYGEFDDIRFA